jgi:flagellar biosynthesis protein FliP
MSAACAKYLPRPMTLGPVLVVAGMLVAVATEARALDAPSQRSTSSHSATQNGDQRETTAPRATDADASIHRDGSGDRAASPLLELSPSLDRPQLLRTLQTVGLFGLISLAPVALLMVTGFVRINVVLILLRQALGSPQVPGNQVLTALSLLLTALVMQPIGEKVYRDAVSPYWSNQTSGAEAWAVGTQPIKAFMVDQIVWSKHQNYLQALYEYAVPPSLGRVASAPERAQDLPLRVVAPAYLLSELTTALSIGFLVYLPFLVIDLVVSSVLAATGLFMLPPSLVAMPIKLVVFVLADGWMLVASMLLSSFAASSAGP